jgi:hypothetical protein
MVAYINHQVENITDNPEMGTKITIAHFLIGLLINTFKEGHVNQLTMDIIQIVAWLVAIVVGILTIASYIKKFQTKYKKKKSWRNRT